MEFKAAEDLMARLRMPGPKGEPATPMELEAAGMIESLLFQLKARIEKAPTP